MHTIIYNIIIRYNNNAYMRMFNVYIWRPFFRDSTETNRYPLPVASSPWWQLQISETGSRRGSIIYVYVLHNIVWCVVNTRWIPRVYLGHPVLLVKCSGIPVYLPTLLVRGPHVRIISPATTIIIIVNIYILYTVYLAHIYRTAITGAVQKCFN